MSWLEPAELATFLAAMLALNLSPGPNMMFALASSLVGGRRAGLLAALGAGLGLAVHAAVATALAATVVEVAPGLLDGLRLAGAAYLLWLGIRHLAARPPAAGQAPARLRTSRLLARGVLTSVTNPKPALFFLAFLPQFTDPAAGSVGVQMALLGSVFTLSATAVNSAVGLTGALIERWLVRRPAAARWPMAAAGVIMIALAAMLAGQVVAGRAAYAAASGL